MIRVHQILLTAAAGLVLAGCVMTPLTSAVGPAMEKFANLEWFMGPAPGASAMQPEPARYCYTTLGTTECHHTPLPDEPGRLVGFAGPPPAGHQP